MDGRLSAKVAWHVSEKTDAGRRMGIVYLHYPCLTESMRIETTLFCQINPLPLCESPPEEIKGRVRRSDIMTETSIVFTFLSHAPSTISFCQVIYCSTVVRTVIHYKVYVHQDDNCA